MIDTLAVGDGFAPVIRAVIPDDVMIDSIAQWHALLVALAIGLTLDRMDDGAGHGSFPVPRPLRHESAPKTR
jgi:hypothetical protein